MKDLGYPRTPTDAKLRVTMPDGSQWDVPVQAIADSRDEHYAEHQEDTIGHARAGDLWQIEILGWAARNMNWSDVKEIALKANVPPPKIDWEEGWNIGYKRIVGEI